MLRDTDGNTKTDIAIPEDDMGVTIMNYLDSGDACSMLFKISYPLGTC